MQVICTTPTQPLVGCSEFSWTERLSQNYWMCGKQSAVSRGSAEAEVISLDVGLRIDGLTPLNLMVLHVENMRVSATQRETNCQTLFIPWNQATIRKGMLSSSKRFADSINLVPQNIPMSQSGARFVCLSIQ